MDKKNAQPSQAGSGAENITPKFADLSADAQRARLLDRLRIGPVSTLEARRELEILCPAARVLELRRMGNDIATVWTREETEGGVPHRVALYVLAVEVHHELAA